MDLKFVNKIPLTLAVSLFKNLLNNIKKHGFRTEDIAAKIFSNANYDPIIQSYFDIIKKYLVFENTSIMDEESISKFYKMKELKFVIEKIYTPYESDPLGYYDINKIYSGFQKIVYEHFKFENKEFSKFTDILFVILLEGCNETLIKLNKDENLLFQNAQGNYAKFIEEYNKIKELYNYFNTFTQNPDYIPRKVCKAENFSRYDYIFSNSPYNKNIFQVIDENKYVVLLSDPGVGKTIELKQIAYHYSLSCSYYPIFVNLNRYIDGPITEFFPTYWEMKPEEELIILLDGFDEIQNKNINDAIRSIGSFVDKHPNVHIVVSCRTNFYNVESNDNNNFGTLNGFNSFFLLGLDSSEIDKYIKTKLDCRSNYFYDSIHSKRLYFLLRSPFYLVNLVKLYNESSKLPESKADIFENLLNLRINLDIEHFNGTKDLREKREKVKQILSYVALVMECLGRNYIGNEELEKILPLSSRELLKYCTAWVKYETDEITWQFEHNNFQEFLAAKKLSKHKLEVIKEFVSINDNHEKIAPSWINTLSFLVSMRNDNYELQNWILSAQPGLFVKFEHAKINKDERIKIFKQIFENYEENKPLKNVNYFGIDELASFGKFDEIKEFLLNKIENPPNIKTLKLSLELLCELYPIKCKDRAKELLIKYALEISYDETVQELALTCLSMQKFNSKIIIEQIVLSLSKSENAHVRAGLYFLLCNSDYLNDYIDVFLKGIDILSSREVFYSSESTYLKEGINKANSPNSIRLILDFFTKNPKKLEDFYFFSEIGFLDNLIKVYMIDNSILESCLNLYLALVVRYRKEALKMLRFFDNTQTRFKTFQKVYFNRNTERFSFLILGTLADMDCIKFIIKEYEEEKITASEVFKLQGHLHNNVELYYQFNKMLVEQFGNKFALPPKIDDNEIKIREIQQNIALLQNKNLFIEEICKVFEIKNKHEIIFGDLIHILYDPKYNFSRITINFLEDLSIDNTISKEKVIEYVSKIDWNYFVIHEYYDISRRNENFSLADEQKQQITRWCYSQVNYVDFKKAISINSSNIPIVDPAAELLWYFLRKYNLSYPENVLLDMISFESYNSGIGIKYLEKLLPEEAMKKRVLENLDAGIKHDFILKNHIIYCMDHRINEILQFTPAIMVDKKFDWEIRKLAMDTTSEISETQDELEVTLPKIKDYFKWFVVEKLNEKNISCEAFLLNTLEKGSKIDKLNASFHLIKLQNVKGIEFYKELVKVNIKDLDYINDSPLKHIHDFSFVPYLIELLEISYRDDINQDCAARLHRNVLDALSRIASNSKNNFYGVQESVENFIEINLTDTTKINSLYWFLGDLELRFSSMKNLDIDQVIVKFQACSVLK